MISSMVRLMYVLRCSRSPGSLNRAITSVTAAVSSSAAPHSPRPRVIVRVSTDASRSASVGAVLPARHEAATTPHSATSRPVQKARWYGQV